MLLAMFIDGKCLFIYFNCISGDLTSTSSQICGSWYLPIFLLRDGSLTLNQHSLSDCSSHALVIPAHNAEIVQGHFMTRGLKVVIDGWWWPQVFPESFSKCSASLPYVFFLAVHPTTLIPVYHPTFLQYVIFVFWVDKELPDGIGPFKMHFNVMSSADVFAGFTQSLHIGHHYVWLLIGGTVCLSVLAFVSVHGVHPCPI